jgi:inorganic phosphate transporter, PiT family
LAQRLSRGTSQQRSLLIGTVSTAAGGLAAIFVATVLVQRFSGRGLLPNEYVSAPAFGVAVAAGAAATVLLATWRGLPVSTTHALIGAIVGAGAVAAGSQLDFALLGKLFIAPLLLGPLLALGASALLYGTLHALRQKSGIRRETCVCIGGIMVPVGSLSPGAAAGLDANLAAAASVPRPMVGIASECSEKYSGRVLGVTVHQVVQALHYASAIAVSMARGMNDVPKLVALLVVVESLDIRYGCIAVVVAMSIGGLLSGHKVAHTMGKDISAMNDGQAVSANVVTALLVIPATSLGLPLSTTHVSTGSIAGVGLVSGTLNLRVMRNVLLAWVVTLPVAIVIGALVYVVVRA